MNIVVVNGKSHPFHNDGGTAITTFESAKSLQDQGYNVCVALVENHIWGTAEIQQSDGLTFHRMGLIAFARFLLSKQSRSNVYLLNCAFQSYGLAFFLCNLACNLNFFLAGHGSFDETLLSKSLRKSLWVKFVDAQLARRSQGYVCNSKGEQEKLPSWFTSLCPIYIVENQPPTNILRKSLQALKNEELPKKKTEFLVFGRIVEKKAIIETIEWFEQNFEGTDYSLRIVGKNNHLGYLAAVKKRIQLSDLSNRIVIDDTGADGKEKWKLIYSAAAIVLLSISEGKPMVLLEAWMLGVPVICTPETNFSAEDGGVYFWNHQSTTNDMIEFLRSEQRTNPMSTSWQHVEKLASKKSKKWDFSQLF